MKRVVLFAIVGVVFNVGIVFAEVARDPDPAAYELIQAGADGPSAAAVRADFEEPLPPGIGHDGQQFYAFARNLTNPTEAAEDVDHPSYRLQRIAYPAFAWLLHPGGGGPGLVWAMVAVNIAALLGIGLAGGWFSIRLDGPPWAGLAVLLLPGAYYALRISTADALAVAFVFAALVALLRHRPAFAAGLATLAVLTKETAIVVVIGYALAWRDRRAVPVVLAPAVAAGTLQLLLRSEFGWGQPEGNFGAPFAGLAEALGFWTDGRYGIAALAVGISLVAGVAVATTVPRRHPLYWAVVLQLLATVPLGAVVVGPSANGTRTTFSLAATALLALLTKDATVSQVRRPLEAPA